MPQLDKVTFLSQFFWLCFFYLGFYYVILKFYLPKISRILALRRKKMGFSHQGMLSLQQENHQVRENYELVFSKAFTTAKTLFTSFFSRTKNWLENNAKTLSKTQYQTANASYLDSLGKTSLSQNMMFYQASQNLPEKLVLKGLVKSLKTLKSGESSKKKPKKKIKFELFKTFFYCFTISFYSTKNCNIFSLISKNFFFFSMFSNDKLRLYLFIFLAFAVLSSKNILIYNEETLVALSFFCFVFFVLHYFGNTITESLNERSQVIREEFQNFLILKEQSFHELLNQHQKTSKLVKALDVLTQFTKTELKQLNTTGDKALKNMFSSRIQSKLKTLSFSKLMVQQKLQSFLSERILSNVLVAFPKKRKSATKGTRSQNKALKNAVGSLVLYTQK